MSTTPPTTVYQVRAIHASGHTRIVHAYASQAEAEEAVKQMRAHTGTRYVIAPVSNNPNVHWAVR